MLKWITMLLSSLSFAVSGNSQATERATLGWQLIEQGAMIIDVRTKDEFAADHIDNALNFPLSELNQHVANLEKDKQIVLYCFSGNRSDKALRHMKSLGFTKLHNAGGFKELISAKK